MPDNSQENSAEVGLVFYSNSMTLEKLAFYRIALALWRNELVDYQIGHDLPFPEDVAKKFNLQRRSSIDSYLQNTIAKCSRQIRKELIAFRDFEDKWFLDTFVNDDDTWIKYFDELVWSSEDYSIDYVNTCQNLLVSHRLSNEEKFAFVCILCMEKHVEELWPVISSSSNDVFDDRAPWPLLYWIDCMRLRNRVNCDDVSNTFDEDNFLEYMPLNRWVIEYFWPYLSFDSQARVFNPLMLTKNATYLKYLLPKLSVENLQRILTARGVDIVEVLIVNEECRPLAILFWNQVRHMFTSNQFFQLVKWMLISEVGGLYYHKLFEEEVLLCREIWSCAPEQWKDDVLHLLSVDNSSFVYARINPYEPYRDLKILKMVLRKASLEQKKNIWRDNWLKFCFHSKIYDMTELIELCLPDAIERLEFKRKEMMKVNNIKEYCCSLLNDFKFREFNDFLEFCSTDFDSGLELKHRLIRSYFLETNSGCSNLYFQRIEEFMTFLDSSFPNPEQCARFKKEFVSKREYIDRLEERLYDGEFATIKSLVSSCLSSEEEIFEWKEEFRHFCYHSLTTGSLRKFDSSEWEDFMMWCLNRDEKVTEFKQSLRECFDDLFEVFLEGCETKKETRRIHKIFDELLKWCLDNDGVTTFKRKYIEANPNDDEIHRLLFGKSRRCE